MRMRWGALAPIALAVFLSPATAQIVTDGTVGPPITFPPGEAFIDADIGSRLGDNLFHSFSLFSVEQGSSATFTGPPEIRNVISRVTGGEPSLIDGALRSEIGSEGFYFFNHAGVLFGPGASIDVPGAFHTGNASEVVFADGATFSSTQAADSSLSVADPAAFGFLDAAPTGVAVLGSPLLTPDGRSIDIVGTDIEVSGQSFVGTFGANVRLQAAAPGDQISTGDLTPIATSAGRVSVSGGSALAVGEGFLLLGGETVTVANSTIDIGSVGLAPGAIGVVAQDIVLDEAALTSSSVEFAAGAGINLIAERAFLITNGSTVTSVSQDFGFGGDILAVSNGAMAIEGFSVIESQALGVAFGGDITVAAGDLAISESVISSAANDLGDGGDAFVLFDTLTMTDSLVQSTARSSGAGGDVILSGSEASLSGAFEIPTEFGGNATLFAATAGDGGSGAILIDAETLAFGPGTGVATFGEPLAGPAGAITVEGTSFTTEGTAAQQVQIAMVGDTSAGGIALFSDTTFLGPFTSIEAFIREDDAPVLIDALDFSMAESTRILATSGGSGTSDISILADTASIAGEIGNFAQGTGTGELNIEATDLNIAPGGALLNNILAADVRGALVLTGDRITIDGTVTSNSGDPTGQAQSRGGEITIVAEERVEVGGLLNSISFGQFAGDGGVLSIAAPLVLIDGGMALTSAADDAVGGDINIIADRLELFGGTLDSSTFGSGAGGTIQIEAGELVMRTEFPDQLSTISAGSIAGLGDFATAGAGGMITIEAGTISMSGNSAIATVTDFGPGGNIGIVADTLDLTGTGGISAESFGPNPGGQVFITGTQMRLSGPGITIAASSTGAGDAGQINLDVVDLTIENGATVSTTSDQSSGGNIEVTSTGLLILDDGSIATSVFGGTSDGGNIGIDGETIVLTRGSRISANAVEGNGGAIDIVTGTLFTSGDSRIEASSTLGIDGEINIDGAENPDTATVPSLPSDFLTANAILPNPCLAALLDRSELIVGSGTFGSGGIAPGAPAGLLLETVPYPGRGRAGKQPFALGDCWSTKE